MASPVITLRAALAHARRRTATAQVVAILAMELKLLSSLKTTTFLPCTNNRFYSGALYASSNGTQVLFGGTTLCRSGDGGTTFTQASETTQMHNDYHAIVPVSGGVLLATDGGVFRMAAPPATGGVVAAGLSNRCRQCMMRSRRRAEGDTDVWQAGNG